MRKLLIEDYTVRTKVPDKKVDGLYIDIEYPYNVRDSMANVLFARELGLNGAEAVKANMLAEKILSCPGDCLLVEDAEWERLNRAIDAFKGFGRFDIELINRIKEAEEVTE